MAFYIEEWVSLYTKMKGKDMVSLYTKMKGKDMVGAMTGKAKVSGR